MQAPPVSGQAGAAHSPSGPGLLEQPGAVLKNREIPLEGGPRVFGTLAEFYKNVCCLELIWSSRLE